MAGIYVIIGEDDYLVNEAAKQYLGAATVELVDSRNSASEEPRLRDIARVEESFSTPPFLEPEKATWWKDVGFLPQSGGKGLSEAVKNRLERLAGRIAALKLPENQRLVITAPKLLQTSVFAKRLKTVAEFTVFAAGKPWEQQKNAVVRAIDLAREMGIGFAPGAAEAFIGKVGTDTRSIISELGKLRDYLGKDSAAATVRDVAVITSQGVGVEPVLWAVTDALGERNGEKAVAALREFENEKGFAVLMTTVIEKFFRQLAEIKDASGRGRSDEAMKSLSPFVVKKNSAFLRNWSLNELRCARMRFLQLRERAVSADDGIVGELVFIETCRVCRRRPTRGGGR